MKLILYETIWNSTYKLINDLVEDNIWYPIWESIDIIIRTELEKEVLL